MNPPGLLLGVDLGTTGLKAGVFDERGNCLALAGQVYTLDQPRTGWAEQSAESWWNALQSVLAQLRQTVDTRRVSALAIVGQSPTIVPVDEAGAALRPAITWADRRATEQAARMAELLGAGPVSIEFDVLPRVLWIRDHEPAVYGATSTFLHPHEYVNFRLTGEAVTVEPLENLPPWTDERLGRLDLDRKKFPARMVPAGQVIGTVLPTVAAELKLSPHTRVVSGTVDAFAHWVGVNLSGRGVLSNIGGTSEGFAYPSLEQLTDPQFRLFPMRSPFGQGWVLGGAGSNSGGLLDWTVGQLFGNTRSYDAVLAEIAGVPAGSQGLLALPYFRGERTPIYDAAARGTFFGLTQQHGPAHMGRALLEGVAFTTRQVMDILEEIGGEVQQLVVSGGTARAHPWNQIKADVTGKPVRVPAVTQSGVLGAAILAYAATAEQPLHAVALHMVHDQEVIEPDPNSTAIYQEMYPLFKDLYAQLNEPYRRLAEISQHH